MKLPRASSPTDIGFHVRGPIRTGRRSDDIYDLCRKAASLGLRLSAVIIT